MPTEPGANAGTTTHRPPDRAAPRPAGPHQAGRRPAGPDQAAQRPTLPDWMLNPPPPRVTLGDRITATMLRVPGAVALRQRWWVWRDRQRLHERFPRSFKIVAFFLSWGLALFLLLTVYALFSLV
ncbi:hypothetical protein [Micromonospora cathayae]|uniref:Uncharacterized protein n=1 Tax=Micromonospora cathayae TaxID=3028804 RepID=A0ABY7ZZT0_9ACTN|nr:hypothetical protein [Micromonospora sp. HUAS 3]WDZ87518.1 hypothetical protein PVK37_14455 [Micromonospora sp. HUAS 3]